MKVHDLKENHLVVDWFRSIKSKPNTRKSYLQSMQFFIEFTKKTPDELLEEAEYESDKGVRLRDRTIKRYLIDFREYLENKNLAPLTIRSHIAAIKSFYRSLDIEIPESLKSD